MAEHKKTLRGLFFIDTQNESRYSHLVIREDDAHDDLDLPFKS